MIDVPRPNYTHLLSLSGPFGTFEHAEFAVARPEHGYCTDDVARVLLVSVRERAPSVELQRLARTSFHFLRSAQVGNGTFRNRRNANGVFVGPGTNHDCWGRAMWALGTAAVKGHDETMRREALESFTRSSAVTSPWPRASAFAVLGAAQVLAAWPGNEAALRVVRNALPVLDRPLLSDEWRWPEAQLTYANATLADALVAAGAALDIPLLVQQGLDQLRWLIERWTTRAHLSVVAARGSLGGEHEVDFDQQPIEVAALSEACVRAYVLSADDYWRRAQALATKWFLGENDGGAVMFVEATGGGYDGLIASGVNLNQGAESTLALLATLQDARSMESQLACAT
ncbi:MAG TPA: hypothetical protein VMU98_01945 [Acidimicrobiales bacterium]|nr:hypothetical protein [Acidimicrobiales bacterium]